MSTSMNLQMHHNRPKCCTSCKKQLKLNFHQIIKFPDKINVKIDKCELLHFIGCQKLHKNPYKSRFISNSKHCSTTILSKHITSALTAVKDHVQRNCF